jgi:hypothetical protein
MSAISAPTKKKITALVINVSRKESTELAAYSCFSLRDTPFVAIALPNLPSIAHSIDRSLSATSSPRRKALPENVHLVDPLTALQDPRASLSCQAEMASPQRGRISQSCG